MGKAPYTKGMASLLSWRQAHKLLGCRNM